VVTENRWKPTKETNVSALEKTLNHVKSLLNKLTREKFVKLTNELCAVDIDSFALLRYARLMVSTQSKPRGGSNLRMLRLFLCLARSFPSLWTKLWRSPILQTCTLICAGSSTPGQ